MSIEQTRKRHEAKLAQEQQQTQAAQPQLDIQALQQAIHEAVRAELQPIQAELEAIRAALNTIANGMQHLQARLELNPFTAASDDGEGEEQAPGSKGCDPSNGDKNQGEGTAAAATRESLLPQAPATTAYTVGQRRQPEPIILLMKSGQAAHEEGAPQ